MRVAVVKGVAASLDMHNLLRAVAVEEVVLMLELKYSACDDLVKLQF